MTDDGLDRLRDLGRCHVFGYARDGRPLFDLHEWGALHSDLAYMHVGATMLDDVYVSTVWIGIPQAGSTPERPLIFETMIFGGELDGWQWRYATEDEAATGHAEAVERARESAHA